MTEKEEKEKCNLCQWLVNMKREYSCGLSKENMEEEVGK